MSAVTPWVQLFLGVGIFVSGARMLRTPQSFVGSGRLDATDPMTVRKFGWFFSVLGILIVGLWAGYLVEGK